MNCVDLFAGAGGWSHGWREATGEPLRSHLILLSGAVREIEDWLP